MLLKRLLILVFAICSVVNAQNKQDVLFTVDNKPVYSDEFLRVFNKNRDIVDEENKKNIDEYLELYVNYKLKLEQAYELKLDTVDNYKRELAKYRQQLIKPYLKDANITKALVKEAYDRTKREVSASHILIKVKPKASASDTLNAYNRAIEIRNHIVNGRKFDDVAREFSEDPSAQKNGGNLGYFSAFSMVYPFENAAYNTKKGEVSMPFRTSFGYHIIVVNDVRVSKGEVEVAHIMVQNDTTNTNYAKSQIQDIFSKLNQGESFDELAQKYSDDKSSAPKGGRLPKFTSNRMIEPFSSIAFSLSEENSISKPFKTKYGWHIVRLIKKHPVPDYKELEPDLIKKIERSERAYIAGKSVADKLKKDYSININEEMKTLFLSSDNEKIVDNAEVPIFSINEIKIPLKELIAYNAKQRKKSLLITFNDFLDQEIMNYYKDNLETTNKDFANTIQEYRDGLLLFDLLQMKVWKRSENDTTRLKQFYDKHKEQYKHKKRVDVIIATCTKESKAEIVKRLFEEGDTIDEIKNKVNEKPIVNVLFSKGLIEKDSRRLPHQFILKEGISEIYNTKKNNFVVVKVNEILEPSIKSFKEARGLVMNDYQDYLEKEWIKELRASYLVKVNKRVLKKIKKEDAQ